MATTSTAADPLGAADQGMSAEEFIATVAPMTAAEGQAQLLREIGPITRDDRLLEIWCGGGDLTARLAVHAGRTVGADYSTKLVAAARDRFPDLEFVESGAVDLPFEVGTFDVVVSNFTAHHYAAPEQNFAEAHRVLGSGGRLLVTIPVQAGRVGFNIVLDAARELIEAPEKLLSGGPLLYAETPDPVVEAMRAAGFVECSGSVRICPSVLESIDTLLDYAWSKIGLATAPEEVQVEIRRTATERLAAWRESDGRWHFPDRLLAVRGIR